MMWLGEPSSWDPQALPHPYNNPLYYFLHPQKYNVGIKCATITPDEARVEHADTPCTLLYTPLCSLRTSKP
jgi:hypothetical protein